VTAPGGAPPGATGPAPAPPPGPLERRARRLLRWYPASWRSRYGDEFAELLLAELSEQPRAWRRTADVARCGITARLAGAGLAGPPAGTAGARASLGTLTCSLTVFLTFGTAMWAQLAVGWQWAPPATTATTVAMLMMSGSLLFLALLALLAGVPAGWALLAGLRRQARGLRAPALLIGAGALVLVAGGRHFGNGWPGTGGHWWSHQGLAPGGIAAFSWASTLSVTSYWAHPAALASFPPAELAWMVLSPAAVLSLATGAVQLVRRLELSPRVLAFETRIGRAAAAGMTAFLAGALCWVAQAGPGPHGLFRAGDIDAAGLAAMAAALAISWLAISRARLTPPARAAGGQ
jgi:hypothetical protein